MRTAAVNAAAYAEQWTRAATLYEAAVQSLATQQRPTYAALIQREAVPPASETGA